MTRVEVAAGLIRDESGRYLLARRAAGTHLAGLWEFPGGKRHAGESLEECLRRELAEELGATFRVGDRVDTVVWTYDDTTIELSFYRCRLENRIDQSPHRRSAGVGRPRATRGVRAPTRRPTR